MTDWMAAHGGLAGLGVLLARYILVVFSMASLSVVVERLVVLRRLRLAEDRDFPLIREALSKRDLPRLRALVEKSDAPSTQVLAVGVEHLKGTEARLREAAAGEVGVQIEGLSHNLPILATAASTAPYVGLFGTVLGILGAFRDIAQTGQTGASVIAGGISEALTSTALGLGVAIPAVIAYNYFSSRVNALASLLESHALDVSERVVALRQREEEPVHAPE